MMTELTEIENNLRDWREKILIRLVDGSVKKWRSYREFSEEELYYLTSVLDILYCNSKFNNVIFELDVFSFTVKSVFEDTKEVMILKYRTIYGYIIRCQSPSFCPLEVDFQRLVNFVEWRRHVIGSYCYLHFKTNDSDWRGYAISHFVSLKRFCFDFFKAESRRECLINMSQYFYFLSKFMVIMKIHRRFEFNKSEE